MEAGVEHLGRGTVKQVDAMLTVADASMKSLEVAKHIYELAGTAGMKQVLLIGNKVANERQEEAIRKFAQHNDINLLGCVPYDQKVIEAEIHGETPLLHENSDAVQAIIRICRKLCKDMPNELKDKSTL
jgi:CO dehydrogenase maturation factor